MCVTGNAISLSDPHYYVNIDNNLEIFTTVRSDTARYECKARNVVGEDIKTIQLTINGTLLHVYLKSLTLFLCFKCSIESV